ncbi:MAG: PfkB family carbohydrate kinase [Chloroflexota bacterium]|nr:PfkB family carbohydrate kinase [Chloroflexota bacterium]
MSNIAVIGMGAINIDCLCQVNEIVLDGETSIHHLKLTPGGSAANTIYGLSRLGIETGFIGATGDDEQGKASIESFETAGVDTSQVQTKKGKGTGYTLCLSDKLGRRSIYVSSGANSLLEWQDISISYLSQARVVHFSSFVDDKQFNIQLRLAEKLPAAVKFSFAPGMLYVNRGIKALSPLFKRTDILFSNKDEIERLTGKDFITGASECLQLGCQIVVVTLGAGAALEPGKAFSSYIRLRDKEYKLESQLRHLQLRSGEGIPGKSQPETTGAGDAFAAGFLFGLLKGKDLEQCGKLGDRMAYYAMTRTGARDGLPELSQFLA